MDNAAFASYFGGIMPYFRNFTPVINDIFVDEKEHKAVVWAKSTAETDIGPYTNEYMLVFYMDESGEKVDKFLEFVDAGMSLTFFPKLREYIAEQEAKKKAGT